MIMPFIRLLTIYVIVILAVVAFFQRDRLMRLSGASFGWPASQQTVNEPKAATPPPAAQPEQLERPEQPAQAAQAEPAKETTAAGPATGPATATKPEPVPQVPVARLPALQMPVTDPEDTPGASDTGQSAPVGTQPAATQPGVPDTQTRLAAARKAYWTGDLAGSGALYAALAKASPDNPDINGEFGNILFAQRRFDEAADAYLITGKLLVESGQAQQIQPIIAVLQNIAPQKAATLRALAGK